MNSRLKVQKLFCIAVCLFWIGVVNAFAQEQKVVVELKNATLRQVFRSIEEQTTYRFSYRNVMIDNKNDITISKSQVNVSVVLDEVLKGRGLTYNIVSPKSIVISDQKEQSAPVKNKHVSGIVKSADGESIIGANVKVTGTTIGCITDLDGNFSLEVPDNASLTISYIGFKTQEVQVKGKSVLNIVLKEDTEILEEVVVVGYGTQKKVDLTGAVASVKMDDILGNRPVGTTSQVLEGAIPGLQISRNNGKPGVSMNLNIRGVTSVNDEGGAPLVLVDNVPMDLDMIDPNDIESVSVLKDAASAAIYGARAAFGIILITTKQGAKDTPVSFNYSNNFSFSNPSTLPEKVSPRQTVQVYKDLGTVGYFGGQDVDRWLSYLDEYDQGMHPEGYAVYDGVRYNLAPTDYYADMMEKFGFQQQHNLSVQGGSKKANYRLAFGMVDEDGILYSDKDAYRRYNVSSFINMDVASWLSTQLDVRYSRSNTSTVKGTADGRNIWQVAHQSQSMAPVGYGYDNYVNPEEPLPFFSPRNMILLDNPSKDRKSDTRILGRVILKPIKNLSVTAEYSYYRQWGSNSYAPVLYEGLRNTGSNKIYSVTKNYYEMKNWFSDTNALNIYANYDFNIKNDHHFKVMIGFNQESYHYEELYGKREDLLDQNLPSLGMSTGIQTTKDAFSEYALRSGFFRFNYDYKNRYLLTVNGRYDGSSRFAEDNRFGFFPSVSIGWRMMEEHFMESLRDIFSNLKPRMSWGSIGNQNVSNYGYMSTMVIDKDHEIKWILPGQSDYVTTVKAPNLVSTSYTWETVETLNAGLDLGMLNNRLQVSLDWYLRDTKNMLAPSKTAPSVLGTTFPQANSASLRTKGWELTVNWNGNIGSDIRYNLGLNLYDSRSKITKYDNAQGILTNNGSLVLREGMEYGEIWGFTTDRFYTADDFDANGKLKDGIPYVEGITQPKPGDILYVDYDNNGIINAGKNTIDDPGDQKIIGNNTPRFQYNINGGISWKDFDLSFIFTGVGKRDLQMPGYWCATGTFTEAVYDYQLNYWTEDNVNSYWPRLYGAGGNNSANQKTQTKYLLNGAFIRLKNLTLGYNLPKKFCNKMLIKNLRFYVSGENLFTFHHLPKGYYPDAFVSIPGSLSMATGIQGEGYTNWSYPLMRQFAFGFNLTF